MGEDGVPGEGAQEIEDAIGNEVHGLNQEVTRAHGGIKHLEVESVADQAAPLVLHGRTKLVLGDPFAFRLCHSRGLPVPPLRFPQLRAQGFELFIKEGTDGFLDNVLDNEVGRVVGAGGLALALVVFEVEGTAQEKPFPGLLAAALFENLQFLLAGL